MGMKALCLPISAMLAPRKKQLVNAEFFTPMVISYSHKNHLSVILDHGHLWVDGYFCTIILVAAST